MFDLLNFGGRDTVRSITGAGNSLPAFGDCRDIIEIATVYDDTGSYEFDPAQANEARKLGHYRYMGRRVYGQYVEHVYHCPD